MSRLRGGLQLRRALIVALCSIAGLQIVLGLGGLVAAAAGVDWERTTAVRDWQRAIEIVVFSSLGTYLLLGARRDTRAESLGALLLLIGVSFAHGPILALANTLPAGAARAVLIVRSLVVEAFIPTMAWLLFRDFPRALVLRRSAALVNAAVALSIFVALIVVAANLTIGIRGEPGALGPLDRSNPFGAYPALVFGLLLPGLPLMIWRTRHAPLEEQRRVRLFASGLVFFGLPSVLYAVLPPLHPVISEFAAGPWGTGVIVPFLQLMLLSMAATTTYSITVQHVLDVRTVIRKAAQYGLARLGFAALAALPFALVVALIFRIRTEPVESLFEGWRALWIAALLGAGALVLRMRRPVMGAIERLLFREPYDARTIVAEVAAQSRAAGSASELARSVTGEIDAALHLESIGFLVEAPQHDAYLPLLGALRQLERSSALARLLAEESQPLRVDLDRRASPLQSLPEEERVWIADAGAALLVPLVGGESGVAGILTLGPKRSELPYSREDLLLLSAVGSSAGIGLERQLLRQAADAGALRAPEERGAAECAACGRVGVPGLTACTECGGAVRSCPLPQTLFGKYRLERRIGRGGMGVVYLAKDLTLGRDVALKTLPATSPEDAARLRREARAMAAITHPNLALIFGVETWQGTPILVIEYLAGSTLADRLPQGPLPWGEALELTLVLANALERAHRSGILHRDVKPSNIGFTEEDVPKLLDFGLVRIARPDAVLRSGEVAVDGAVTESGLAGTPLYMSPEALSGERSDPTFDLWSLSVVAFEAIAGRHPFERETPEATLRAIQQGATIDMREARPDCPEPIVDLFGKVLARERSRRPSTAREFASRLRSTVEALAA
jgi:hypothetical protein